MNTKEQTLPRTWGTLIIGAGFSGLGMAVRLKQSGIDDLVILERASEVGGTWRDTRYPGAACDVPSILYSYSFAPNPQWSRSFSPGAEIQDYILHVTQRHELRRHIVFGQCVTSMSFDQCEGVWTVTTAQGKGYRARSVVNASGPLSNASFPAMPGIELYQGHKVLSAQWDSGYDFKGKRVAVIGTGASAVQIVPELVKVAAKVKVFQRTPGWVLPRLDQPTSERRRDWFQRWPWLQTATRLALFWLYESTALGIVWTSPLTRVFEWAAKRHLHRQVRDPWLRRQLLPTYRMGCKRILLSSDYFPALQKSNCELVTWPIDRLCEEGIRTCDGLIHQFDCMVFATGYDVSSTQARLPMAITDLGGRRLQDDWSSLVQAYKSTTISGYPNLYWMLGPNGGPGHHSALLYIESQINYAAQGIGLLLNDNLAYLDVREEVQMRFNIDIQDRLKRTNWNSGCKSWYLTKDGKNPSMFPGFATQFDRQLREFDQRNYRLVEASSQGLKRGAGTTQAVAR